MDKKKLSAKAIALLILIGIIWLCIKYDQIKRAQNSDFEFLYPTIISVFLFYLIYFPLLNILKNNSKKIKMLIFAITGGMCGLVWFFVYPNDDVSIVSPIIAGLFGGSFIGFFEIYFPS